MNIIIFGPPGAGKGTQSDKIANKYQLFKISTGDLLRNEIKKGSLLGKKIEEIVNSGTLVSDNITNNLIEKVVSEKGPKVYFRISVLGGGCSGFKYNFSFDDKIKKDDNIFEKTLIDKNSLKIINGSIVDFKKELIGNSFIINNPKANSSCGCGLSFSV